MSFREDFEAALREEQRVKEELNRLRREHKAAKERLEKMREYAKEFKVNLDGEKPSDSHSGASNEPDHSGETVQN